MDHNTYSDQYLESEGFVKALDIDFGEAVVVPVSNGYICFKLRGSYGELWFMETPRKSLWSKIRQWITGTSDDQKPSSIRRQSF